MMVKSSPVLGYLFPDSPLLNILCQIFFNEVRGYCAV